MIPISQVVDQHHQKYLASCSPSLIEMILKAYEKVPMGFYDLQHKYRDENVGLTHFRDQDIEGLHFQIHDQSTGQSFLDRLQEELKSGRIVGLYCLNRDGSSCHGWIVDDVREGQVHLLSKYSEEGNGEGRQTVKDSFPLEGPEAIRITDLVFALPVSP
jgi:hypothetical protein